MYPIPKLCAAVALFLPLAAPVAAQTPSYGYQAFNNNINYQMQLQRQQQQQQAPLSPQVTIIAPQQQPPTPAPQFVPVPVYVPQLSNNSAALERMADAYVALEAQQQQRRAAELFKDSSNDECMRKDMERRMAGGAALPGFPCGR